jgi:nucleotide-binding universal stress UspA family protein
MGPEASATRIILCAVDGSVRAPGVIKAAAQVARAMGARIVLYRAVVVPPDFAPAAATAAADPLPAYLERKATAELTRLGASVSDVPCELRVVQADQPWRAILAAADAVEAELIVLGSHGYHGWDHVLGTTAGKIANLAQRNVLIVHDRKREAHRRG